MPARTSSSGSTTAALHSSSASLQRKAATAASLPSAMRPRSLRWHPIPPRTAPMSSFRLTPALTTSCSSSRQRMAITGSSPSAPALRVHWMCLSGLRRTVPISRSIRTMHLTASSSPSRLSIRRSMTDCTASAAPQTARSLATARSPETRTASIH